MMAGIVWMTAKFFYYAGNESGWWGRLERQFRKLNTKKGYNAESDSEELHSMNAPPFEVLEDIADQVMIVCTMMMMVVVAMMTIIMTWWWWW